MTDRRLGLRKVPISDREEVYGYELGLPIDGLVPLTPGRNWHLLIRRDRATVEAGELPPGMAGLVVALLGLGATYISVDHANYARHFALTVVFDHGSDLSPAAKTKLELALYVARGVHDTLKLSTEL